MNSKAVKLFVLILGLSGLAVFSIFLDVDMYKHKDAIKTQEEFIRIQTETPYDAIYQYYKALEGDNWDLVKSLTTPDLWKYIETSGFKKNWEKRTSRDPTLKFVLFTVSKQEIDEDKGWIMGKVDWSSKVRNVPDDNRTVFVEKQGDSWIIAKIISLPAVEVVDDFYEAINAGDLRKAQELTTQDYWNKLVDAGVIHGIRKERSRVFGEIYVIFFVEDFSEKKNEAWVSGDVSFKPLTQQQKEVTVNVHVVSQAGEWKIDKIVGHWDMAK
jgi:hypothetical protein